MLRVLFSPMERIYDKGKTSRPGDEKLNTGILGRTRGSEMAFSSRSIPVLQLIKTKRANIDQIVLLQRLQAEQRPGRRGNFLVGWQSGWLKERLPPAMGRQQYKRILLSPVLVTQRSGNLLHRAEGKAGKRKTALRSRQACGASLSFVTEQCPKSSGWTSPEGSDADWLYVEGHKLSAASIRLCNFRVKLYRLLKNRAFSNKSYLG